MSVHKRFFLKSSLLVLLSLLALMLPGCGGGGGTSAGVPASSTSSPSTSIPPGPTASLLSNVEFRFLLAREVPSYIDSIRFTGFDSSNRLLFGPVTVTKRASIVLENVPSEVSSVRLEFLSNGTVIGLGFAPVSLIPGRASVVDNPDYSDVAEIVIGLSTSPQTKTLALGLTFQVEATAALSTSTQSSVTNAVRWSSSNESVATVNAQGLVQTLSEGTTIIRATLGNFQAETLVTVGLAEIVSLELSPLTPTIAVGDSRQFRIQATLTNQSVVEKTDDGIWAVAPEDILSLGQDGLAVGLNPGQCEVSFSLNGQTKNTVVNVIKPEPTLDTVRVEPPIAINAPGSTRQLRAIGIYSDGSEAEITDVVTWTSSAPTKAAVSNSPGEEGMVSFVGQELSQTVEISALHPAVAEPGNGKLHIQRFLYIAAHVSNRIYSFLSDASNASISNTGSSSASDPHDISMDPTGRFLYAMNRGNDNIQTYAVTPLTGQLTEQTGVTAATGVFPEFIVWHPKERFLYCANGGLSADNLGISVFEVDITDGSLHPVAGSPFFNSQRYYAMNIRPSGDYLTALYSPPSGNRELQVFSIDQRTGALALVQSFPSTLITDLEYTPDGRFLYVATRDAASVTGYSVDSATGRLTVLDNSPFEAGDSVFSVAIHHSGRYLYSAGLPLTLHTIDSSTGDLTAVATFPTVIGPWHLFLDPRVEALYTLIETYSNENNITAYKVDPETGLLSNRQDSAFGNEPKAAATTP